jgi:hypothetical protein
MNRDPQNTTVRLVDLLVLSLLGAGGSILFGVVTHALVRGFLLGWRVL